MARRIFLIWLTFTAAFSAGGTSIHFPMFSRPVPAGDCLLVTSPDSRRLLCLGLDGKKRWEKAWPGPVHLFAGRNGAAMLQTGSGVSSVQVDSGELRPFFTIEDGRDVVSYHGESGLYISQSSFFSSEPVFKILDDKTGHAAWSNSRILTMICGSPDLMVGLSADRVPVRGGHQIRNPSLELYSRPGFQKKWTRPFPEDPGLPASDAVLVRSFLVIGDGERKLVVLDAATGRPLAGKTLELPETDRLISLQTFGELLVWLTCESRDHADPNQSRYALHFCTLPDLKEIRIVRLALAEISRVSFAGDFIITDALYRTACFRMTGEKVWELFQNNRTDAIRGTIYFSDHHNGAARKPDGTPYFTGQDTPLMRVGKIEVATGRETIVYSEASSWGGLKE